MIRRFERNREYRRTAIENARGLFRWKKRTFTEDAGTVNRTAIFQPDGREIVRSL